MSNETYNGWTNYSTWRINLEIFDGMTLEDFGRYEDDAYTLGDDLKFYAEEIISIDTDIGGLAYSYAMAFMSDVNWTEIASAMIETYKEEQTA